mgnify:CR=1 FL=1|jgi:hypothetical protein
MNLSQRAVAFLAQKPLQWPLPRQAGVLGNITFPAELPFDADCFTREDESDDSIMYARPIMVTHIDDDAIRALTKHYTHTLPSAPAAGNTVVHLDLCSSWVSFLPNDYKPSRSVGLGMNSFELCANKQLTEALVHDLNNADEPLSLPFADSSFDAITNVVSVDYVTRPLDLFAEMHRCLKPGGIAIMSFSNRMFWHKAVRIWTEATEWQRILICGLYFDLSGFEGLEALEVTEPQGHDPLYIVQARKPLSGL